MSKPLIITDCDEVLLHMVAPFSDWLGESKDITFDFSGGDFATALKHNDDGRLVDPMLMWQLLGGFFDSEMHRQMPIAGAVDSINHLRQSADVVVLTNLNDERQQQRTDQLAAFGLDLRVFTNQGPKGPALRAIIDEYQPSAALFIDDLPQHHDSVSQLTPEVLRLHLVGEPLLAPYIACAATAGHAHARIDDWASALPWIVKSLKLEDAHV